jgi:hypothetical protein
MPPPEEEWELGSATSAPKAAAVPDNLTESWPEILTMIGAQLGNGTVSLLNKSTLRGQQGDTLVIQFPPGGKVQKQMCESNGRAEQIAAALSEHLGTSVRIKFELADAPAAGTNSREKPKPNGQKRYEILNDPAVKSILVGLEATITKIEEQ